MNMASLQSKLSDKLIIRLYSRMIDHTSIYSARVYKHKLKAWGFEKYLRKSDMQVLLAKAEKRASEDNKDTVFRVGGRKLDPERLQRFKKRKLDAEDEGLPSPSACWYSPFYYSFLS